MAPSDSDPRLYTIPQVAPAVCSYTFPRSVGFVPQTIAFTYVVAILATSHFPVVTITDPSGFVLTEITPNVFTQEGSTYQVTFGVDLLDSTAGGGFNLSTAVLYTGLPALVLPDGSTVTVQSVDPNGVVLNADTIANCVMWGTPIGVGGLGPPEAAPLVLLAHQPRKR